MAAYSLSGKATGDLDQIYEYTILNFGLAQGRDYLRRLHDCFEALAAEPALGRGAFEFAPGLRRKECRSHVVFYVPEKEGVRIVRVLHESMNFSRHL